MKFLLLGLWLCVMSNSVYGYTEDLPPLSDHQKHIFRLIEYSYTEFSYESCGQVLAAGDQGFIDRIRTMRDKGLNTSTIVEVRSRAYVESCMCIQNKFEDIDINQRIPIEALTDLNGTILYFNVMGYMAMPNRGYEEYRPMTYVSAEQQEILTKSIVNECRKY